MKLLHIPLLFPQLSDEYRLGQQFYAWLRCNLFSNDPQLVIPYGKGGSKQRPLMHTAQTKARGGEHIFQIPRLLPQLYDTFMIRARTRPATVTRSCSYLVRFFLHAQGVCNSRSSRATNSIRCCPPINYVPFSHDTIQLATFQIR